MKALAIAAVVVLAGSVAARAEGPSFDCRSAETPREIAVCADADLARADRDLAAAYRAARRRLPAMLAETLVADQRGYVGELDDGFSASMWFKGAVPDDRREVMRDLRRALRERSGAIAGLREDLEARTEILAELRTDRPGFAGRWAMHGASLELTREVGGEARVDFAHPSYGWPKYQCRFTATARRSGDRLVIDAVEDGDLGDTRRVRVVLHRDGPMLIVEETRGEDGGHSACVRASPIDGAFFAVGD